MKRPLQDGYLSGGRPLRGGVQQILQEVLQEALDEVLQEVLEEVLEELNAAHANQEETEQETPIVNEEEKSGLFGDNDNDNDSTNYEMVISLSNEALEHLWAIVITFVVFNAICVWCYYNRFGGKNKRYGDSLPSTV